VAFDKELFYEIVGLRGFQSYMPLQPVNGERDVKSRRPYLWQELDGMVVQAQQGDQELREEIFSFLHVRFLVLAKHRLTEGAEDVVQETLMVVYKHFSELETLGKLLAFGNQVLRNKIGNVYQKRRTIKGLKVEMREIAEPRYYINGELDAVELNRIIRQSIDKVGEKHPYCRAILLGLYEGLSASEISIRLGISKSQLKVRTFRCRQALREVLLREYRLQV